MFSLKNTILLILLALILLAPNSIAQVEQSETDQKIDVISKFFGSAIDSENIFATFDDFFDQNECKRVDLYALINQRDTLGSVIRKGILNPEKKLIDVQKDIERWELVSAELFFLRSIEVNADIFPPDGLRAEIRKLYPNNKLITNQQIAKWEEFYSDRLTEYQTCQASFKFLAKKFKQMSKEIENASDNFINALTEFSDSADDLGNSIKNKIIAIFDDEREFTGEDFFKTNADFGPYDLFWTDTQKKIKRIQQKLDDPVKLAISNSKNSSLTDLARDAAIVFDEQETVIETELEEVNAELIYNNADRVIHSIWGEVERTTTNFQELASTLNNDINDSLTKRLSLVNSRQCRLPE